MNSSFHKGGPPRRSTPPPRKPARNASASASKQTRGRSKSAKPSSRSRGKAGLGSWAAGRAFRAAAVTGLVGLALSVGVVFGAGYLAGKRQSAPQSASVIQDAPVAISGADPLPVQARRFERAIAELRYEEPPPEVPAPAMVDQEDHQVAAVLHDMADNLPKPEPTVGMQPESAAPAEAGPLSLPVSGSVLEPAETEVSAVSEIAPPDPPPWLAHAVPGPALPGAVPEIAIVIDDMGLDQPRSRRALDLPAPITVAFLPYGYHLSDLAEAARTRGHEILVHLPMEPTGLGIDPGPNALLTTLTPAEIRSRMDWALSQFGGFVGFNNHMGSRFTAWNDGMQVVLDVARERGLLFLDSVTTVDSVAAGLALARSVPFAARDVFLDHDQAPGAIAAQLARVETVARERGQAIAIGHPHDTTLAALLAWMPTLKSKGFRLVPVSTVVQHRAKAVARGQG